MSEKEKKIPKKKSRNFLSLPSFRKSKKLNQIKEDVYFSSKDESEISNQTSSKHGSENSLPSIDLEATVSLDSPRKVAGLDESLDTSTPNNDRKSFSNLRSAYLDNPDLIVNPISPRARRLDLGGSNNLSTDSGIDCSILLSEKGSPERFQAFTRREAERIRQEHLLSLNDSLTFQTHSESIANDLVSETTNSENLAEASAANSLQEQIQQTKEHINLLSELRTVLEQKLEACNNNDGDNNVAAISQEMHCGSEINHNENYTETTENVGSAHNNANRNRPEDSGPLIARHSPNITPQVENFNLYLHTNRTDERKSEDARIRLESSSRSVANGLLIDSPHLMVSPVPIVSTASTASHRILPSTPSPVRLFINDKSAFAKCKSLRRSVSDVGKGLIGKLRQKKKVDLYKDENDIRADKDSTDLLIKESETEKKRYLDADCNSSFSAHLQTSLLCEDVATEIPVTWEMTDLNSSIGSSYEIDFVDFENSESNNTQEALVNGSNCDQSLKSRSDQCQRSINVIQDLTNSICEMTTKLKLTSSYSADSIDCICNCKNRSESPPCCDKSKTPSPVNMISENLFEDICDTVERNTSSGILNAHKLDGRNTETGHQYDAKIEDNQKEKTCDHYTTTNTCEPLSDDVNRTIKNTFAVKEIEKSMLDYGEESEIEVVKETDCLLEKHTAIDTTLDSKVDIMFPVYKAKAGQADKSTSDEKLEKFSLKQDAENAGICGITAKKPFPDTERVWHFSETDDDSSDSSTDSSVLSCSGCSDENCSSGKHDYIRNRKNEMDSSSGDTSQSDFNTCYKSSDSDSDSSSIDSTCNPEKDDNLSSCKSSNICDSIIQSDIHIYFPMNSPQNNLPSPDIQFSPNYLSETPASSPVMNLNDCVSNSPVGYRLPEMTQPRLDGCRRKDTYIDISTETVQQNYKKETCENKSLTHIDIEASLSSTANTDNKQPDIIKDVKNSPHMSPLDLSLKKKDSNCVDSRRQQTAWADKHVGQVLSPAKRVLHKNRNLSEKDLCKTILDSYISDAEESGFEPDCEYSFSSAMNYSHLSNTSDLFNDSLNCSKSNSFSTSRDSSVLESGLNVDDSMLQYGVYVAPRRPKKETNVDDFSTSIVSSCYTAEAKTRKLQGGPSCSSVLGAEVPVDVEDTHRARASQLKSSQQKQTISQRKKPYNPRRYQMYQNSYEPVKEEMVKTGGRLCSLERVDQGRVKGRRESRDTALKDQTNAGIVPISKFKSKTTARSSSVPILHEGKENTRLLNMSDNTFDQLTILHTAHNGKRKVRCLSVYEAQSIVKHYPPPRQASSISWGQTLSEMDLSRHTPRKTPIKTKPILLQNKDAYPYNEETPSPIVLTRLRRSKSLSKKFKNWPW